MLPFIPPPVEPGDMIYHYETATATAFRVGFVITVFERTIEAHVFSSNTYNSMPANSVRHRNDPDRKVTNESGYWDFTPTTKAIKKLLDPNVNLEGTLPEEPKKKVDAKKQRELATA